MDLGLAGRTVLVTGGSRGIGRAIALAFGAEGSRVTLTYHSDGNAAQCTADEIRRAGGDASTVQMDLAAPATIEAVVRHVMTKEGHIDVLVNNAIEWLPHKQARLVPLDKMPAEEWQRLFRANTEGPIAMIRAVVPGMRERNWGRIVSISSTAAEDGVPGAAWYATAKASLHGMTRTLAGELGRAGILVNNVLPGITRTDDFAASVTPEQIRTLGLRVAIGRLPTPQEIAALVVFLASAANTAVTGESVRVSGGRQYSPAP